MENFWDYAKYAVIGFAIVYYLLVFRIERQIKKSNKADGSKENEKKVDDLHIFDNFVNNSQNNEDSNLLDDIESEMESSSILDAFKDRELDNSNLKSKNYATKFRVIKKEDDPDKGISNEDSS